MRVCYVGGLDSIHLRRHAQWMASRGHDVHVITWSTGPEFAAPLDRVTVWETRFLARGVARLYTVLPYLARSVDALTKPTLRKQFHQLYDRIQPDVVHGHFLSNSATVVAEARNSRRILTAWGSDVMRDATRSWAVRRSFRIASRRVDALVCVASHLKDEL